MLYYLVHGRGSFGDDTLLAYCSLWFSVAFILLIILETVEHNHIT